MITETIFYYEDYNDGLGKKYIVTRGPCIPIKDRKGDPVTDSNGRAYYENAPEKLTEVPRK